MTKLGPYRLDAISTSQRGWCAVCDELPIKEARKSTGRGSKYTCGRAWCKRMWGYLATLDREKRAA